MRFISRRFPTPGAALALLAGMSALALATAFVSQYAFGHTPCELCIVQRIWHGGVIVVALAALFLKRRRIMLMLQCAVIAGCLATSVFHIGVEQHWWAGTRECVGETPAGNSLEDLTKQILSAPLVRCDEVNAPFAGLSMATWDAILCLAMLMFGLAVLFRRR